MYTGNSRSDFIKLAIAKIQWELPCMAKLYRCLLLTRYGVVQSPHSSWKCNTLYRNTESPHDFRGGGIFHKCLSSEIRGARRISVFALRKNIASIWQKKSFKSESPQPADQKTKKNKLFFLFLKSDQFHNYLSYMPWRGSNTVLPMSMWVLSFLAVHLQLRTNSVAISVAMLIPRTQRHRSLVTGGGESVGAAPASWAKTPRDEELHQAQPPLKTQIWEGGWFSSLTCESFLNFNIP